MATGTRRLLPNLKLQRFKVPVVLFGCLVTSGGFVTTKGWSTRSFGATAAMSVTAGGCGLSKGEGLSNEPQSQCIFLDEKG